jgi:ribosomal protein L15
MPSENTARRSKRSLASDAEEGNAQSKVTENHGQDAANLLRYFGTIGGSDVEKVAILSFRALQLYRIAGLQQELVVMQKNMLEQSKTVEDAKIDEKLQRYGKLVLE